MLLSILRVGSLRVEDIMLRSFIEFGRRDQPTQLKKLKGTPHSLPSIHRRIIAGQRKLDWYTGEGGYNTRKVVTYNTLDSAKKLPITP